MLQVTETGCSISLRLPTIEDLHGVVAAASAVSSSVQATKTGFLSDKDWFFPCPIGYKQLGANRVLSWLPLLHRGSLQVVVAELAHAVMLIVWGDSASIKHKMVTLGVLSCRIGHWG